MTTVSFNIKMTTLREAAIGLIACASDDKMFPALNGAHFEVSHGAIEVMATDRYAMCIGVLPVCEAPNTGQMFVPLDVLKAWAKLPKRSIGETTVTSEVNYEAPTRATISWQSNADVTTVSHDASLLGSFPVSGKNIMPTTRPEPGSGDSFGMNVGALAKWSKLTSTWELTAGAKHLYGTPMSDLGLKGEWKFLRMPVRVES